MDKDSKRDSSYMNSSKRPPIPSSSGFAGTPFSFSRVLPHRLLNSVLADAFYLAATLLFCNLSTHHVQVPVFSPVFSDAAATSFIGGRRERAPGDEVDMITFS